MVNFPSVDRILRAPLSREDAECVRDLMKVLAKTSRRNALRSRYYDMREMPRDLGISVPPNLRGLKQAVGWPKKAVESLADRSQFDGFTCDDPEAAAILQRVVADNGLKRKYRKLVRSELKHCCAFLAVTDGAADGEPPRAKVSAYPATGAAAIWDHSRNRIKCGLVVADVGKVCGIEQPTRIDVFTDEAVVVMRADAAGRWAAERREHGMGRCLMEPLAYDATLERPFGRSRITRAVMDIADDAARAARRSEIAAEFLTSPQKYLMGADKEAIGDMSKWDAYIGSIFAVSKDRDGDVPQFGQLSQGTLQPHIDYMRSLAARFSGETNVPLSELGVVADNPASAEAIYAAKEAMVVDAQNLNADNAEALRDVALMALAVEQGTTFEEQVARGYALQAKFKNPAMPSVVSQADAMLKIAQVVQWMPESDVFLEELGFSDDQMQRLRSDRAKSQSRALVARYSQGLNTASDPARAVADAGVEGGGDDIGR